MEGRAGRIFTLVNPALMTRAPLDISRPAPTPALSTYCVENTIFCEYQICEYQLFQPRLNNF